MTRNGHLQIRPASREDTGAIADVWHVAWLEGHRGHVPDALLPFRGREYFREHAPSRIEGTAVALRDGSVVGFVTVRIDEVELVFVAASARGTGVADALLRDAEGRIAHNFHIAWLAVVEGNARARRFYERHDWRDVGPVLYAAEIPGGTLPVQMRRYEKALARVVAP